MPKKPKSKRVSSPKKESSAPRAASGKPSSLIETRIVYCGDNLDQLRKLPDGCVDLIYIDPPFNSNRNYNYEVFWSGSSEPRLSGSGFRHLFEDRHESIRAYIEYMRLRCDSADICGYLHERTSTRRTWLCC